MSASKFDSLPATAQAAILKIAMNQFSSVETLETRSMDGLDFHDCHVGSIREALAEAFEAGLKAGVACGLAAR